MGGRPIEKKNRFCWKGTKWKNLIRGLNLAPVDEEEEATACERPCPILFPLSLYPNYLILTLTVSQLSYSHSHWHSHCIQTILFPLTGTDTVSKYPFPTSWLYHTYPNHPILYLDCIFPHYPRAWATCGRRQKWPQTSELRYFNFFHKQGFVLVCYVHWIIPCYAFGLQLQLHFSVIELFFWPRRYIAACFTLISVIQLQSRSNS